MHMHIVIDGDLMRFELKIIGMDKIKQELNENHLCCLNQGMIDEYFQTQVEKLILKPLDKWKKERTTQLLRVMREEQLKHKNSWQIGTIRRLMNDEVKEGIPKILDVEDICKAVDDHRFKADKKKRIKEQFRRQAAKYEGVFCQGDDQKLDELLHHLTVDETQQIECVSMSKSA